LDVDDPLAASVPGVRPHVELLLELGTRGRTRLVRGLFAYLAKDAHDPSRLPDAFYVRVGFALGGRRPPHKILVSLLKQSTSGRRQGHRPRRRREPASSERSPTIARRSISMPANRRNFAASSLDEECYVPTAAAAKYLGFRSTSAVRKAVMEGRLFAVGRRGGVGPLLFTRAELDRFARGSPPATLAADRPGAPPGDGEAHGQDEVDATLEVLGWRRQGCPASGRGRREVTS
jgi:hypothetical protein